MPPLTRLVTVALGCALALAPAAAPAPDAATAASAAAAARFVSPRGSDSGPCTRSAPCGSFDRALRAARPGDVVEAAAGSYAGQQIRRVGPAPAVVVRPAAGAAVSVGEIEVYGSNVELRSLKVDGWSAKPGARNITFRNVRTTDLFITSANGIRVIGGSVGPGKNYDSQIGGSPAPENILIDGVYFHDWTRDGDAHVECLQFGSGVNVTIRNNRFENCATHDIFVRSWGRGYPLRNWVVENNLFDETIEGYYSFKVNGDLNPSGCGGFVVRNNSALQAMFAQDCPGGITWAGNLGPKQVCYGTFSSNVWYGAGARRCTGSDRAVRDPRFVNARAFDLRLGPGSPAIDSADAKRAPARDIRGTKRPLGRGPDAGAFETR